MRYDQNVNLDNINACINFGEFLSICYEVRDQSRAITMLETNHGENCEKISPIMNPVSALRNVTLQSMNGICALL